MTNKHRPTVLILASDSRFGRDITAHWPPKSGIHLEKPEFVVLDKGLSGGLQGCHYDLAIADATLAEVADKFDRAHELDRERSLRETLVKAGKPAIVVHAHVIDPRCTETFSKTTDDVIDLHRESEFWPAIVGLVGREIVRRRYAELRGREAERAYAQAQAEATLGRFMLEMRTNVNNALTTVLGNAELLGHEPGLPATVQSQADAIRNMALRLHEIFQRFSSIEKEMNAAAHLSTSKVARAGQY